VFKNLRRQNITQEDNVHVWFGGNYVLLNNMRVFYHNKIPRE